MPCGNCSFCPKNVIIGSLGLLPGSGYNTVHPLGGMIEKSYSVFTYRSEIIVGLESVTSKRSNSSMLGGFSISALVITAAFMI